MNILSDKYVGMLKNVLLAVNPHPISMTRPIVLDLEALGLESEPIVRLPPSMQHGARILMQFQRQETIQGGNVFLAPRQQQACPYPVLEGFRAREEWQHGATAGLGHQDDEDAVSESGNK